MINIHIAPILVAFFATLLFIKYAYDFAVNIKLVDRPDERKHHAGEIPLIGGLSILFGFSLACLLSPRSLSEWRPLFLCLIPLVVTGCLDDHKHMSVSKRVLTQILTCLIMIYYGHVQILDFGDLLGIGKKIKVPGMETLLTIICVVGVINALNLIDGIDGLCGMVSLTALIGLLLINQLNGSGAPVSLMVYFIFSLLAFLSVNLSLFHKFSKKVFLGDAGTTVIGFFICWYFIKFSQGDMALVRPITAVWLLAIPIMDTLAVMIHRFRLNKSLFKCDRMHMHHLLQGLGLSQIKVLLILTSLAILHAAIGIISEIYKIPEYFQFYGIIFVFTIFVFLRDFMYRKISKH